MAKKAEPKKPLTQGKPKSTPHGLPDAQGDVYDDIKLEDEYDPGAYLGDQYIMLGDEHPEGPWK